MIGARVVAIWLSSTLLGATGCAHVEHEPVKLRCSIASRAVGAGYVVTYTLRLTNVTTRTIIATRLGLQPWRQAAVPLPTDRGGDFDDQRRLAPSSSHFVYLHTSVIPGPRQLFAETPLSCNVTAVAYEDGTYWTARDTFAVPLTHRHGPL